MSKYSIILPVRNGSNHVKECVAGILSQTYTDFELIVLENSSTDDTLDIINSFNDTRIRIIPAESPLSMVDNWARAVTAPKNEFMTLIGHDDVLMPDYLFTMDKLIAAHPNASLYQTHFRYIDGVGRETGQCQPMAEEQSPEIAVFNFMAGKNDLMGTGFMMRSRDYDEIGGIPAYPNLLFADMELWIELARKEYLAVSPAICFSYRRHAAATTASSADKQFLSAFSRLVDYLEQLRRKNPYLQKAISEASSILLKSYCQGITHKILRVPKRKRETPGVEEVIALFKSFGPRLGNPSFNPLDYPNIKVGLTMDNNPVLRAAFLLFKRIYPKAVLHS